MYILSIDGVDGVKPNIIVEANPTNIMLYIGHKTLF